ncbi:IS110 family transposase [Paenibacillus sp. MY03]|jgi:transposase|uniref:IS110 family transposase n=1 Tax=Paenibacillus sp. MY03 TaxID=302980 RepID=UPI000B3D4462|nr:IS110 family transposase [Paenibacillus sp. MY03]OUS76144.1 IS110 family transposase [Paenibacillus sp. MY03]
MHSATKYVGLDVSKEKISVAIADAGSRDLPRYFGTIPHTAAALRKLIKEIGPAGTLAFCYEAGPTGYETHRWIESMGASCTVIAPSLMPKRPGDRIKNDRRDAEQLARLFRSGELTPVYVPDREDEALRELVRARETAKEDIHRARQRVLKFLLRYQVNPPETIKRRWTKKYHVWLTQLTFAFDSMQIAFTEMLHALNEVEQRMGRIEKALLSQASVGTKASIIQVLQSLRGIGLITAITVAAEIGSFARFRSPAQLMAYLGLVPREHSSGVSIRRGAITKAGNGRLRRALVESAWSYRHRPAIKGDLAIRLQGLPAVVQQISWNAQVRLHKKYRHLVFGKNKHKNVAISAVARELTGFIWAVARSVEHI